MELTPMESTSHLLEDARSDICVEEKPKTLTWRDIPQHIISLLDTYPYNENYKAKIRTLSEGLTLVERIKKNSHDYQECYLSQALYYFIQRDYEYSLSSIKNSIFYYRIVNWFYKEPVVTRSRKICFYALLLRGLIYFLNNEQNPARRALKKALKLYHNDAVAAFYHDIKFRK